MDTAALPSLTAWMDGVDQLSELLPLLPVLVSLELLLSADNAIALAAIARGQKDPNLERRALNLGIGMAFGLRVALILMAQFVLAFPPIQLVAGLYLLWLCIGIFKTNQISQLMLTERFQVSALAARCLPWPSLTWPFPLTVLLQLSPSVIRSCWL